MARLTIENTGRVLALSPAISILNTLMREGIPIKHVCGGKAQCGTCRVTILSGAEHLSRIQPREARRLAASGNPEGVRLACQTYAFGDITIRIPGMPRRPDGS